MAQSGVWLVRAHSSKRERERARCCRHRERSQSCRSLPLGQSLVISALVSSSSSGERATQFLLFKKFVVSWKDRLKEEFSSVCVYVFVCVKGSGIFQKIKRRTHGAGSLSINR